MDAIAGLMSEHEEIVVALTKLEAFCDALQADGKTDKTRLGDFVEFLSCFADTIHHGKEEELLFKVMQEHDFPVDGGPIAVMLEEHDEGREYIAVMRAGVEQESDWSAENLMEICQAAQGYTALLRAHINKEDNILYKMALEVLPPEAMTELGNACAIYDETHGDELNRMRELASRLG